MGGIYRNPFLFLFALSNEPDPHVQIIIVYCIIKSFA